MDKGFNISSFGTPIKNRDEVYDFIKAFISKADLRDTVTIFK